jgi:cytochrome c oxidase assembly protein subunit 15
MFLFLGSVLAFGFALRLAGASKPLWRRYFVLVGMVIAQGALGMTQYWLGVPEVLVSLHVFGAICVVIATATLWAASRDRGAVPVTPAEPATAEGRAPEYSDR